MSKRWPSLGLDGYKAWSDKLGNAHVGVIVGQTVGSLIQ